ncbi:MAG: hypothetical protein IKK17_06310, partial [Oscillospiraceae bacterium]|nr:hypothetical protein [Oscillospiraceae bacterium]
EIYMFNHFKRIGQSAADTVLMEQLNADIATVCSRYGVTVVDLYNTLTDPAYIGDGKLHPNKLGMDMMTEAMKQAITARSLSLRYDDRYDVSGKTVEIVDGNVVTLKGNTLVVTGIGTAKVSIDGVLHEITVEKAKINLVMIMGQSNAGNHFANATSAVTCPPGTAYWWKDGATAPADYTEPSKGFHTPLLAELYAQSAAAGDPVKNVMLWTEGATSKNGQSIVKWAVESGSGISTAGTDKAAAMMKNCLSYYQQHSDTYEIVGKYVYWLQGESDYNMDPQRYIRLFTAMWERLKGEGMEKLAFLRVRGPTFNNTDQNMDTVYNAASAAQFEMVRSREDMFMATTLTEAWTGPVNTSHSVDVSDYITVKETYGKSPTYSDSYGNKATYTDGVLTTTMKELYGSNNKVHYGIFGYGLIGADAAYNMHRALHGGVVTFVQIDSSGRKAAEHIAAAGTVQTIDIENLEYDLSFYPGCGSPAGTMQITVTSAGKDITQQVISTELNTYGCVSVEALRGFADSVITVKYTHGGKTDEVRYEIKNDPCAKGHSYANGICTVCGSEHPNLDAYSGKVISVLGDSISTFAGYIPVADGFNLEHLSRYPQDDLLTDVNETWWMQTITALDCKLGINDSWRGATVSGAHAVTTGSTGENAAMHNLTRIQNLGSNGTPDIILFYGGTNDLAHVSKVGTFDATSAPTVADHTTKKWDNLADGYVHTLLRLKHYYPNAQIVCLLPTYTTSYYSNAKLAQGNAVLASVCKHYGVPYVDLRDCGITTEDLPDGIHPNAQGMDYITEAVIDKLLNDIPMAEGESAVYPVTHKLTNATASKHYYKGVSAGRAFTETLGGDGLTVTVTMGGKNVTASVYKNGTVTIPSVTGEIVITAKGVQKPVYEDYLLQLPEVFCENTNLWPILEHNKEYYGATGWTVHGSGKVYSVTIPVAPGDRVYATSFGKQNENGGTINGIRATWFNVEGVLESMSADAVYAEFSKNGYLTAPESATAINVPMWTPDDTNELYILNIDHSFTSTVTPPTCTDKGYTTHTCTVCGDSYVDSEVPAAHTYKDNVCTVCGNVLYAARPANGREAFSVEVNVASAVHNGQTYVPGTDYGYIQFPTNYTPDGEPTRLVIICHGAGATLENYQAKQWQNNNYT